MKYCECVIAYDEAGPIKIGAGPDTTHWSSRFNYVIDGVDAKALTRSQQTIQMLAEFINAITRDCVPLDDAHCAFLGIDEYRQLMLERSREDDEDKQHARESNVTSSTAR